MAALWSLLVTLVVAAVVIFIVGKMNLGLSVGSFMNALVAAIVIAVVTAVVLWLLGLFGITLTNATLWGAIVSLIVAAVILMISDKFLPGMSVAGFSGAIIAAIAIGVVNWIILWLLGLFGITV